MAAIQHDPATLPSLKAHIVESIRSGGRVIDVCRACGVGSRSFARWRRDDPGFDKAIVDILAARPPAHVVGTEVSAAIKNEAAVRLKRLLVECVEAGEMPTKAALAMGVNYSTVMKWRKHDPEFQTAFDAAVQALTHIELDKLRDLHEEVTDPKALMAASKNRQFYIQMRNRAEFGERAQLPSEQPQLLSIMQSAINRLIDHVAQHPAPLPAIDAEAKQVTFRDDPQDAHKP